MMRRGSEFDVDDRVIERVDRVLSRSVEGDPKV